MITGETSDNTDIWPLQIVFVLTAKWFINVSQYQAEAFKFCTLKIYSISFLELIDESRSW